MQTYNTPKRARGPWPGVPDARRRVMQANRPRDTAPELLVRRMLHRMGYRFRLHRWDLPGRPDLVFPGRRVVIQVHGCFWHQHPGCRHARVPKSRQEYWGPKFVQNAERNRDNERRLAEMGWRVLVVWECELVDLDAVARRAECVLGPVRERRGGLKALPARVP
jgi:DNA mismatch endonuclease Vsr